MQYFKSKTLWQEIERRAKKCSYKVAAVAYCTSDDVVSFGAGDLLVTDASDAAIRSRQTDRRLLRRAYRKGAELYSCPGLHAKVLIFDEVAIIGSANLSQSSRKDLIEAGLVTNNPTTVAEARAFVEQLVGQSDKSDKSDKIDEAFLKRIDKLKLKPFRPFSKRRTGIKIQDQSPGQLWIAGLHKGDEDPQDSEQIAYWKKELQSEFGDESVFDHFWISGTSTIRQKAKRGDRVIQVWREDRKSKKPDAVYHPVYIRDIHKRGKRTWFIVERRPDEEDATVTWSQFQKHLQKIEMKRKVGQDSIQLVSVKHTDELLRLWKAE